MTTPFEWKPEPIILEQLIHLAQRQGRSPEAVITQAVILYLQSQSLQEQETPGRGQALVNLMRGKATVGLSADEIMQLTRHTDD